MVLDFKPLEYPLEYPPLAIFCQPLIFPVAVFCLELSNRTPCRYASSLILVDISKYMPNLVIISTIWTPGGSKVLLLYPTLTSSKPLQLPCLKQFLRAYNCGYMLHSQLYPNMSTKLTMKVESRPRRLFTVAKGLYYLDKTLS